MIKIFAIIGESGSGKNFLVKKLSDQYPIIFNEIIPCTTRPKRESEQSGVDYFFLSEDCFLNCVNEEKILGKTYFKNWYYGIFIDNLLENKINIGVFNPMEIKKIIQELNKKKIEHQIKIYRLSTLPKERLLRQLNREKNPDVDEIIRRYSADKRDFNEIDFKTTLLFNNIEEDLELNIEIIKTDAMKDQDNTI